MTDKRETVVYFDIAKASSRQLSSKQRSIDKQFKYKQDNLINPPYSLEDLANLMERNYAHFACVGIKAKCVSGAGHRIVSKIDQEVMASRIKSLEEKVKDEEKLEESEQAELQALKELLAQHLEEKSVVTELFNSPNETDTFQEIQENTIMDLESLGTAYWEVLRDKPLVGKVVSIYHMPSISVRITASLDGVCQIKTARMNSVEPSGYEKVYFINYGSKLVMDPSSGTVIGKIDEEGNVVWNDSEKTLQPEDWATEVITFKKYAVKQGNGYGLPDIIPALGACACDTAIQDFNLNFFENRAIPDYAIVGKGLDLSEQQRNKLESYFNKELRNSHHKTIYIEIPAEQITEDGVHMPGGDVKFEKLATEVQEGSFIKLYHEDKVQTATAHSVPISLLPGEQATEAAVSSAFEIFKDFYIRPLQRKFAMKITKLLIKDGLGIGDVSLEFSELTTADVRKEMEVTVGYLKNNILSRNEVRKQLGLPPIPGGDRMFEITPVGVVFIDELDDLDTAQVTATPGKPLAPAGQGSDDGGRPKNGEEKSLATLRGQLWESMKGEIEGEKDQL